MQIECFATKFQSDLSVDPNFFDERDDWDAMSDGDYHDSFDSKGSSFNNKGSFKCRTSSGSFGKRVRASQIEHGGPEAAPRRLFNKMRRKSDDGSSSSSSGTLFNTFSFN